MSQKILVIDDSRTVRRAVEWVFHGSPYTVLTASTASEAMELLRTERPTVALVDYHLPDQSGYDFCGEVRTDNDLDAIGLVLLGGEFHGFEESRVAECGANDFILKPFKTDALIEKVTNVASRASQRPLQMTPGAVDAVSAGGPPPPPQVPESLRPNPTPMPDLPSLPDTAGPAPAPPEPPKPAIAPPPPPQAAPLQVDAPIADAEPLEELEPTATPEASAAQETASTSGFRPVSRPAEPAANAADTAEAAPAAASAEIDIDPDMVRDAVRQAVPAIVKDVLAALLRESIGPKVEQYAMRKIDAFVERDLPRLAEEAIDKQLADLAGD